MKFAVTLIIAVVTLFIGTTEESQAQFYRGGSGLSISVGNGGFGGFGFGRGFYGGRSVGGFGVPVGYGRSGVYSSYRPVYGRSFAAPVYGGRSFYGGGRSFYGGGRSCGGW